MRRKYKQKIKYLTVKVLGSLSIILLEVKYIDNKQTKHIHALQTFLFIFKQRNIFYNKNEHPFGDIRTINIDCITK